MEKCIDIFSRLLIATITFVVPIIINLLSTFAAGIQRREKLAKATEDEIKKQLLEAVQENPEKIRQTIDNTSKQYKEIDKRTRAEIALLSPLVQFWNIFIALLASFILLIFNYLIRSNTLNLYSHILSILTLLACGLSYLFALFFIIRILYTITKTKKITEIN